MDVQKELKKIGLQINDKSFRGLSFIIDDAATFEAVNPLCFKMSESTLAVLYVKIESLGFFGKRVIKALCDSIKESPQNIIDNLRFNYWSKIYTPKNILQYFVDYLYTVIEKNGVYCQRGKLNIALMRNLWFSFGGYRGLKALFKEVIVETNSEFARLKSLEEKFVEAMYDNGGLLPATMNLTDLKPNKIYTENVVKNPCITCKYSRVDMKGYRHCTRYTMAVPDYLTAGEIVKLYPKSSIKLKHGMLMTDVIAIPMKNCENKKSRIAMTTWHHAEIQRQKLEQKKSKEIQKLQQNNNE